LYIQGELEREINQLIEDDDDDDDDEQDQEKRSTGMDMPYVRLLFLFIIPHLLFLKLGWFQFLFVL